jgi:hypothetical protein
MISLRERPSCSELLSYFLLEFVQGFRAGHASFVFLFFAPNFFAVNLVSFPHANENEVTFTTLER